MYCSFEDNYSRQATYTVLLTREYILIRKTCINTDITSPTEQLSAMKMSVLFFLVSFQFKKGHHVVEKIGESIMFTAQLLFKLLTFSYAMFSAYFYNDDGDDEEKNPFFISHVV